MKYSGTELELLSNATRYINWIVDLLNPYLKGDCIEVGAGLGSIADTVITNSKVTSLHLVEPDTTMSDQLNKKYKDNDFVTINNGVLADLCQYKKEFDVIYYINVLEHINHDINEINTAYSLLKKGGYICIFVPAHQLLYSDFDKRIGHIKRYSKATLENCFDLEKFNICKCHYLDVLGFFMYLISQRFLNIMPSTNMVVIFDKCIVPLNQKLEKCFIKKEWIPFGKSLFLVAQKK